MRRMRRMSHKVFRFFLKYQTTIGGILVLSLLIVFLNQYVVIVNSGSNEIHGDRLNYRYTGVELNSTWKSAMCVNFTWNSVLNLLEHISGKGDFLPSDSVRPSVLYPSHKSSGLRNEPLTVFVLLHSHNDPGYRRTFDEYYNVMTKRVLTLAVQSLMKYKDLTFIWTDTCFLERWWKEQDNTTKNNLKHLAKSGRFEISLGAWVSADECITHYFAYLDQLTEGYNWIEQHLDVFPNVSFNMDQFGSSASVNYMRSVAGVKHSFVNHLHKGTKKHFRKYRLMEFHSRQLWGEHGTDDSFIHVEPYDNLAFRGSCGPSEVVCLALDERNFKLPHYKSLSFKLPKLLNGMPYWNVHQFAEGVVDQLKLKNDGYLHNVVLLPLGNDLIFYTTGEWENQHRNMKILMEYINSHKEFNVQMQFGTLSQYFEEVKRQTLKYQIDYPVVSGDFFPYTRGPKYWSGYFTTRQFVKRLGRELQESVRTADLLSSFLIYNDLGLDMQSVDFKLALSKLTYARQQVYIFQHHDAITGTSEDHVVKDYKQRLSSAFVLSQEVLSFFVEKMLTKSCGYVAIDNLRSTVNDQENKLNKRILPTAVRSGSDVLTQQALIDVKGKSSKLILLNSYTQRRLELITVSLKPISNVMVSDPNGHPVDFDVEMLAEEMKLSFVANLPPVSISVFNISSFNTEKPMYGTIQTHEKEKRQFVCQNSEMNVTYSMYDGSPLTACLKTGNMCLKFKVDLIHYTTISDAWTFANSGEYVNMQDYSKYRTVSKKSYCSVEFFYKFVTVKFVLHNVDGINGRRLQMDVHDNLAKATTTNFAGEFAVRLQTNIENGNTFYTDSNSMQLMKRIYRENLSFGGNIYPMTSMAVIQDNVCRLTVHSSQPHGVISRRSGSLDVMIDRVVTSESDKTVREFHGNTKDNLPTFTKLFFQFEQISLSTQDSLAERLKPSINSVITNDFIQHPVFSFFTHSNFECKNNQNSFLNSSFPNEMIIANMKCLIDDDLALQGVTVSLFRREISQGNHTNNRIALDPSSLFLYSFKSVRNFFKDRIHYDSNVFFEPLELKTFIMN